MLDKLQHYGDDRQTELGLNPGNLMLWWKVWNDQATATQKWRFFFFSFHYVINHNFIWSREISSAHLLSQDQWSFGAVFGKHAAVKSISWTQMRSFLGVFQEAAGKFSIKRDDLISVGVFVISGGFALQHYSSTFLCHTDFIPDRSCLDVPVGRKCSACNGLAPEFFYELEVCLIRFSPSLPPNCNKTPWPWGTGPCGQYMYKNTCQVFIVFDGLHME